jgi:hypothetical protein
MTTDTFSRTHDLKIQRRFNGPRRRANGGFATGTFADLVGGTATVTLHRGVPLDRPFGVAGTAERLDILQGTTRIATVTPAEPFVHEPPARPTRGEAEAARAAHPFRDARHALSDCIVCGPHRADGMRVTPGPLAAQPDVAAAPYDPRPDLARDDVALSESVWGALDCVSYPVSLTRTGRLALLGSLTAHRTRDIAVGESLVAVGWTLGSGTRSHRTASALLDEDGAVVASARAVWVELRHQRLARVAGRWL